MPRNGSISPSVETNPVRKPRAQNLVGGLEPSGPVIIRTPQVGRITVPIIGIEPLVVHAWSEKARKKMLAGMQKEAGTKMRIAREPRNPVDDFNGARYTCHEGNLEWDGVPCVAFKSAMVEACRQVEDLTMTEARRALFVKADGHTDYHSPNSCKTTIGLVRIYGEPEMREDAARNDNGGTDLRYRPQYWPWRADLQIEFNASKFKDDAIMNLVAIAGFWEGVCEWRPGSKKSNSGQLGRWMLDEDTINKRGGGN